MFAASFCQTLVCGILSDIFPSPGGGGRQSKVDSVASIEQQRHEFEHIRDELQTVQQELVDSGRHHRETVRPA